MPGPCVTALFDQVETWSEALREVRNRGEEQAAA
jgi:hypothetical protein